MESESGMIKFSDMLVEIRDKVLLETEKLIISKYGINAKIPMFESGLVVTSENGNVQIMEIEYNTETSISVLDENDTTIDWFEMNLDDMIAIYEEIYRDVKILS